MAKRKGKSSKRSENVLKVGKRKGGSKQQEATTNGLKWQYREETSEWDQSGYMGDRWLKRGKKWSKIGQLKQIKSFKGQNG